MGVDVLAVLIMAVIPSLKHSQLQQSQGYRKLLSIFILVHVLADKKNQQTSFLRIYSTVYN